MIVDVSATDLATAVLQGFSNPARAAALTNLDSMASSIVGAANWRSGNYIGSVTYRVGNSVTTVTEDKACDSNAIDQLAQAEVDTVGGGGGGFTPGLRPVSTVDGGINTGTVTVGDIISAP